MLYPDFRKCVIDRRLVADGDTVVVAVSGGIDSMVLLDLICRAAPAMRLSVVAAHVNHRLRGRASLADEALVTRAAKRYGIVIEKARLKPAKGKNMQDTARRLRYEFLLKAAKKHGAASICTAHHAGDQAETVLMHMLRGSGLAGLCGMAFSSMQRGVRIIRPLLAATRSDIEHYARERRILFREDATNAKEIYRRNAVRHRLIPLLREFNPRIEDALALMSMRLADDDDALGAVAEVSLIEAISASDRSGITMRAETYKAFPLAIRRRMLRLAYTRVAGTAKDLNSDQLLRMDQIVFSPKPRGQYRLPAGIRFTRDGQIISIRQ